jgi:membrane associated rhomboid family serine protease
LATILLFITAVFFAQLLLPGGLSAWMTIPADVEMAWDNLLAGVPRGEDFRAFATLVTGPLMHGGWSHLLYNLLFLWIFAGLIGELLGMRWMLVIFFATAIAGAIGDTILRAKSGIPSLGISGAVMGFEAAYLGLAVKWKLPDPEIWPISHPIPPSRLGLLAVVGFFFDVSGAVGGESGTAYGAHLGGFVTGLFVTCFLVRNPVGLR